MAIEDLLLRNSYGHLGCCLDSIPYVFPMAYVYNDNTIYGQTTSGKKLEIIRQNPNVCFQIENKESNFWESVIVWGEFEELDFEKLTKPDQIEITRLLTKKIGLNQKELGIDIPYIFDKKMTKPMTVNDKTSSLFRIAIHTKSGKSHNW